MLTKNERALLFLIAQFGTVTRMKLVKLIFLLSQDWRLYDFVPYRFGPFSFQLYHDLLHLKRDGHINMDDDTVSFNDGIVAKPDFFLQESIKKYVSDFSHQEDRQVIDYVYDRFPEFTIFSEIKRLQEYRRDEAGITTIGYEGRNIDAFLLTLIRNKICTLIDVRKNPYSMKYGFSKNQLSEYICNLGMSYVHLPDLGIDSERRKNLSSKGSRQLLENYKAELESKDFLLSEIRKRAEKEKVALMCFERDVARCHRGVIANKLRSDGMEVTDL